MDIYIQVPKTFRVINYPSNTGEGYDLINYIAKRQIKTNFNELLGLKKVQIILSNYLPSLDVFVDFPYYDIENHEWVGKKANDHFGKSFI